MTWLLSYDEGFVKLMLRTTFSASDVLNCFFYIKKSTKDAKICRDRSQIKKNRLGFITGTIYKRMDSSHWRQFC